jgi:lipid-A-disaccharide synthase-like uncharacterized protein
MTPEFVIAYSATIISLSARFIFMYLLYTKKSTNPYSLIFTTMNIVSSSLWITYSQMITDTPIFIRGTCDLILFSISTGYIIHNRIIESDTLPADDILLSGFGWFVKKEK